MDEGLNEREAPLLVAVKIAVALLPAAFLLYQQDQRIRWAVDHGAEQLAYRVRLALWRRRVWDRMPPHEQERYVELHGRPD